MRHLFLFLVATLYTFHVSLAQIAVASKAEIEAFFKTKTLVVLDGSLFSEFSVYMSDAAKQRWHLTEYEFIAAGDFESKRKDPQYSFLMRTEINFKEDKDNMQYTFLSLVLGGEYDSFNDMPDIASIPLAYKGSEVESYAYKLPALVDFLQNHVETTRDNPSLTDKNIITYYNKNLEEVKGKKTIMLVQDDLSADFNSLDKVQKLYSGDVEFISREDLATKIGNKEDIVFLHKVGPGPRDKKSRCFKLLIGSKEGTLHYWDWHKIGKKKPDSLLLTDFKRLERKQ